MLKIPASLKRRKILTLIAIAVVLLFVVGFDDCDGQKESDKKESTDVERQQKVFVDNQPPPFFEWSLERYMFSSIYEARNKAVATYSYVQNQYTGKIMHQCASIGFPIPANAQLTNPTKSEYRSASAIAVLDQAEPNGLYTSPSTKGTYVPCVNKDGKVVPWYSEPDVQTFLVPQKEVNGELIDVDGAEPSLTITPKLTKDGAGVSPNKGLKY